MAKKKAKPTNTEDGSAPAPKAGMGKAMQMALIVVLGLTSFMTVYLLPSEEPAVVTEGDPQGAPSPYDMSDMEIAAETTYLPLEPMTLSIQDSNRVLKIGITLEIFESAGYGLDPADPKLRDAFMGYLRSLRSEQIQDAAYMAQLRSQLLRRAQIVAGPDIVSGVLITDFLVR